MILWTIQHYPAYQKLLETGILIANEGQDDFRHAYDWMARKMIEANICPASDNICYPVWA
jgi:tRNA isopentenyl-2-thiomethyl-A-37 hydroxylase MiaE